MRLVAASLGERPGEAALIWGRGDKGDQAQLPQTDLKQNIALWDSASRHGVNSHRTI